MVIYVYIWLLCMVYYDGCILFDLCLIMMFDVFVVGELWFQFGWDGVDIVGRC